MARSARNDVVAITVSQKKQKKIDNMRDACHEFIGS